MSGNQLRNQLRDLRRGDPTGGETFIPQRSLYRLLKRDVVSATLRQSGISVLHIDSLTDKILKGGQKVFTILVLLKGEESKIFDFVKRDQFSLLPLDSRLPFSVDALATIVPDIAQEFYETQWELLAPVFSKGVLHRELQDMIRLPYVRNKQIGRGGFGDVYEIELEPAHQTLAFTPPEDNLRAVRKEFKSDTGGKEDWEKELHNLSLLGELKHLNMVELLSSYSHRRKHNLIFRLASHGDLAALLEKNRPEGFEFDDSLFRALAQLASAICAVHNFTSKRLDLKFIGCHHDLKPKNVLFDGRTFILADFGLSRFKEAAESSKEPFEVGQGHYLAPECEDPDDGFKKHIISRPSDIWSFGCITAELLTYMLRGPGSASNFKKARVIKIGSLKTYTFHGGRFRPNPSVDQWLSELEREGKRTHRLALQLVRSMLALNPNVRPKAQAVSFKLGYIATVAYIDTLVDLFSMLLQTTSSVEADMEQRRFKAWAALFESTTAVKDNQWSVPEDPMTELDPVLRCLAKCKEEILSILDRYATALSPLYSDPRALTDQLHNFLPLELKKLARSQIEQDIVSSEDVAVLETMHNQYNNHSATERICMLLTIKRISILAFQQEKRNRPNLYIEDPNHIKIDAATTAGYLGEHNLATIQEHPSGPERKVVVEWIRYTTAWEGPVSEEMMARVEAIAALLNNPAKPISQVLHCSGYYHEPNRYAFGVVYEFPVTPPPNLAVAPRTLSGVIQSTMDPRSRPSLEERFLLAYRLVNSVIDCHKVGWMHKSISAHNIAFFHSHSSHPSSWIQNPYIIGFNHSRRDDPKAFTLGPGMARFREYQHPLYHKGHRFVQEFDFYSLGIVLLEIGLWTPLQSMVSHWKYGNLEELRLALLSKRVPILAYAMGNGYRGAVELCLSYMPETPISRVQSTAQGLSLGLGVLMGLGKCPCEGTLGLHSSHPRVLNPSEPEASILI